MIVSKKSKETFVQIKEKHERRRYINNKIGIIHTFNFISNRQTHQDSAKSSYIQKNVQMAVWNMRKSEKKELK